MHFNSSFTSAIGLLTSEYAERTLASKTSFDVEKLNNSEILKPTRLCEGGLLFRVSVLDEIYCGFAVSAIFCAVLRFLTGPYAPLKEHQYRFH